MKIYETSIRRPVTVLMCVMIVLVLGWVSLTRIPIDLMPNINIPVAIVSTTYSGAGPEEVENIVTKRIENAVATVNNIKTIQSISSEGSSIVIAQFNDSTDMDFATLQMREKVELAKAALPDDAGTPTVMKIDPNSMPVVTLGITDGKDEAELKRLVEDKIEPRLERLDGVASISLTGGKENEIKVYVDPRKLSGYGLSFNQIVGKLQSENLNKPGGTVQQGGKKYMLRSLGEFKNIQQIKDLPIILPSGQVIYLSDVAAVEDGYKEVNSYNRMNGESSISLSVQKQTDANTVEVASLVKEELERIKADNPGINISMLMDQSEYIQSSIDNVVSNVIRGGLLAVIILFLFLKNIRTTFIIGTSIPISVIATFVMIYFYGITLNMISLGGLALGVGMLVDSSIVVLENIYRHRMEGLGRRDASIEGTREVAGAVLASILTTVVVFLPIVFTEGMAAEIFKELALTVTFSLMASLIVALTLIPMLSSKFLKVAKPHEASRSKMMSRILDKWDDVLNGIDAVYRKMLGWVLKHRKRTVLFTVIILTASMALIPFVGMEFFPSMDEGQFSINIEMAHGTMLEDTDEVVRKIEKLISDIPEVDRISTSVGSSGRNFLAASSSNSASVTAMLKPLEQRKRSTFDIVEEVRKGVAGIAGADITVSASASGMGAMSGSAVSLEISGPDLDILREISAQVEGIVSSVEGTRQVESSISKGSPEVRIYVDRDKASQLGFGAAEVAGAIRTAVEGTVATAYRINGNEINVRVSFPEEERKTVEQLKSIKITSTAGAEVPLMSVARIDLENGPVSISRKSQERFITVTADVFGAAAGNVNNDIATKLQDLSLPSQYSITFGGQQQQMNESFSSLFLAFGLGIILVYMIMAAQFESLIHPLIIMFSIPLAFTGSILGLVLTGSSFNVASFIGIIMLLGIVVNNAIVLIDYINQLKARGMDCRSAIIKAGPTRLRPILMTTLTTILGLVPMAMGLGEGAETMAPLAIVVIGGLSSSTLLTLVFIPLIYSLVDDLRSRLGKKLNRKKDKAEEGVTI